MARGGSSEVKMTCMSIPFKVNLRVLSESSGYFQALSQSGMREASENFIRLHHVSSGVFHNFLEFTFYNRFQVPMEELATHIQVQKPFVPFFRVSCPLAFCKTDLDHPVGPHCDRL